MDGHVAVETCDRFDGFVLWTFDDTEETSPKLVSDSGPPRSSEADAASTICKLNFYEFKMNISTSVDVI